MNRKEIEDILRQRILVLDGGLGTMVQGYGLVEADYRGERFASWPVPLAGCNDVLVLTQPDKIAKIHEAYLLAGADIISTDSFNATSVSLVDYGLQEHAYEINREAALVARSVADEFTRRNPTKPRLVAGSMGPTNRTASISADVNDPASRAVTFDGLAEAYATQARGLVDGGADILLIETVFDTLNAKAAVFAIEQVCEEKGIEIPVMISGTLADASGRTLSGQTVEAFYYSMKHARPLSIGFNCAYGAKQMRPYLVRLAEIAEFPVSAHPNAGLPNVMGGYDETPQMMADDIEEYLKDGLINIIGGCCGTTPAHIGRIAEVAAKYKPRAVPAATHVTTLSGLEPLRITPETNFVNIGERANVAGSAKFARLIREGNFEEAIGIARQQVEAGAQVVDVCMDDGLIDGEQAMTRFLNLAMSEPEISRVPFMIDSSSWEVLEAGLKCVQGKSIVNSISLKEGEDEFLRRARIIRRYGAAAVVMLFDERGQADVYDRKIEVAKRAYDLLVADGFPPEDIVFDPNILAIGTGIEEHNSYGADFIEACRWIKKNLPFCKVSGGVSNLSFAFRGNNKVREAMHSVFLYHAIAAGMDMGIVNPAMLQVYSDIEPELLHLSEALVLNLSPDATERMSEYAERVKSEDISAPGKQEQEKWRSEPLETRIEHAMMKGVTSHIEEDIMEAYHQAGSAISVIDGMLMPAMDKIGVLFGEGKMFLPQVVKSARVMRMAVNILTPYMEQSQGGASKSGRMLMATVKGDVHDIGKNIVAVVMSCNGYSVDDLGVMVETNVIADKAENGDYDIVGLSGLISPSLDEMAKVVTEFERRGLTIPVIIGGATTSDMHTAVKIAPHYSGVVVRSRDASENTTIANKLLGEGREEYIAEIKATQALLRQQFADRDRPDRWITLEQARANRRMKSEEDIVVPAKTGRFEYFGFPVTEAARYIDWNFFFPSWGLKGKYPEILDSPEKGDEARKLFDDAQEMIRRLADENLLTLNGVAAIYPAVSEGDDILITDGEGKIHRLAQLRNQESGQEHNFCLSDYLCGAEAGRTDYVGAFTLTSGVGLTELIARYRSEGDEYNAIMAKFVADRLAEAFAEAMHHDIRHRLWGYEKEELTLDDMLREKYQGVRVAFGYPACPDHSLKKDVFELLGVGAETGMEISESYMIRPGESVCGLMFAGRTDKYFSVGKIDSHQLADYARRRSMEPEEIRRLISQHLR